MIRGLKERYKQGKNRVYGVLEERIKITPFSRYFFSGDKLGIYPYLICAISPCYTQHIKNM
jgi:hypothetical protein